MQTYMSTSLSALHKCGGSNPGLWQYRLNSLLWYNAWPEKQATLVWENRFQWIGKWLLCIRNPDTIETRSVQLPLTSHVVVLQLAGPQYCDLVQMRLHA